MKKNLMLNPLIYDRLSTAFQRDKVQKKEILYHDEVFLNNTKNVLAKFGLPVIRKYIDVVEDILTRKSPAEKNYLLLENTLKRIATEFLNSPIQTNRELLLSGKEKKESIFEVLPLMNLPYNCYNIFLYNQILMKSNCKIDSIVEEFKSFNFIPEQKQKLLLQGNTSEKIEKILKKHPLKYMKRFNSYIIKQKSAEISIL